MHKHNLLICEDKKVVLYGLKKMTEGFRLPIDTIYLAENGQKALSLFEENPIDLVMTDIQMPEMDGLEMLSRMQRQRKNFQAIIISGHDDFTYAKTAIQLGIDNYLLKPVDSKELFQSLNRCIEALTLRISQQQILSGILLDQIREVWSHALSENTVSQLLSTPNSFFHASSLGLLVFYLNSEPLSPAEAHRKIRNYLKGLFTRALLFSVTDHCFCAVINLSAREKERFAVLHTDLNDFLKVFFASTGAQLFAGLAPISSTIFESGRMLMMAESALYSRFAPHSSDFVFCRMKTASVQAEPLIAKPFSALLADLRLSDITAVERDTHTLIRSFARTPALLPLLPDCLRAIQDFARQSLGDPLEELLPVLVCDGINTLAELEQNILSALRLFCRRQLKEQFISQDAVAQAIKYMEENYQKPLTLTIISNVVSLNYTYFSSIFKKRTGVSVTSYLQNLRLQKAKNLLISSNERIGEVARKTGFTDERYFSKLFKQMESLTPREYRQKLSQFTEEE